MREDGTTIPQFEKEAEDLIKSYGTAARDYAARRLETAHQSGQADSAHYWLKVYRALSEKRMRTISPYPPVSPKNEQKAFSVAYVRP